MKSVLEIATVAGSELGAEVRGLSAPVPAAARAPDLVRRRFSPAAPDRLWVADFTYVPTTLTCRRAA